MEADFKKEKKKQMKLREQLKKCQIDRDLMNQQLRMLESDKNVTVVNGHELDKIDMSIADMNNYR